MAEFDPSNCILAEKSFIKVTAQMEETMKTVTKLYEAIMGNGKPGIVSEINQIKMHIGYNQDRTVHERLTTIEQFVTELRDERREMKTDLKGIILPLVREGLVLIITVLATLAATGNIHP